MKIDSLSSKPDRSGKYTVRFDDGSVMRLYRQTIEDFDIYSGREFTDQQLDALKSAAGAMSAKMRAVRIVAASSVSKGDLEQRLVRKGEDPEQAKDAVQWMSQLQLIDDRKTAEQIVSRCAGKGYGIARAKQALYEKRIPKEYWDDVLTDYPDQSDVIATYLQDHLQNPDDPKQVRKVVDALMRKGHSYQQIRSILSDMSLDAEWFQEE